MPPDAPIEPVAEPVVPPIVDAVVEPPIPPVEPPAPELPARRVNDPLISTITGLRAKNRELETRAEIAEREASEAKALADRLARSGQNPVAPVVTAPPRISDDEEVDRRANYKLFVRDVNQVQSRGMEKYGTQFVETIKALEAVGANSDVFVSEVMAVDRANAHVLLNTLAQDLERTVSLVNMDPTSRIAALTRMAMAPAADADANSKQPTTPPAPRVSRAPAPPPPVEPSSTKIKDWRSDEASDEEFDAGFTEMMKRKSARR
jgi:hypothetical protein